MRAESGGTARESGVSRAVRTERRVARWDLKGPGSQTEKPLQDFRVGKKNVRELGGEYFRLFVTK